MFAYFHLIKKVKLIDFLLYDVVDLITVSLNKQYPE